MIVLTRWYDGIGPTDNRFREIKTPPHQKRTIEVKVDIVVD
jgi:uncharacterized protein YodC (DUF2158 family)